MNTPRPKTLAARFDDAENVPAKESAAILDFIEQRSSHHSVTVAVMKALIAEAIYELDPKPDTHRGTDKTYLEAWQSSTEVTGGLRASVNLEDAAEAVIRALDLETDNDQLMCDSDGVTGVDIDGFMRIPFRCEDCAEDKQRHLTSLSPTYSGMTDHAHH